MSLENEVNELLDRLKDLITQGMRETLMALLGDLDNEKLLDIYERLIELEFKGPIIIKYEGGMALELDVSSGNDEEENPSDGPENKFPVSKKFGFEINQSPEDLEMANVIKLDPIEIADFNRAVVEIRGPSKDNGQTVEDENVSSALRTAEEIVFSIREYARQYGRPIERHLFLFTLSKTAYFQVLGEIIPGDKDPRVILYLIDNARWLKKIEEIISFILALSENDEKIKLLLILEDELKQYVTETPK